MMFIAEPNISKLVNKGLKMELVSRCRSVVSVDFYASLLQVLRLVFHVLQVYIQSVHATKRLPARLKKITTTNL